MPEHSHEQPFFCLVLEGQLDERFEGRVEPIPAGSVLFHPAKTPHAEDVPWIPSRAFNIQPDGDWLSRLDELDLTLPAQQRVAGQTSRLPWLARQIYGEWLSGDAATSLAVEGLLLGMLAEILRAPRVTGDQTKLPWLHRVRDALHASVACSPTIVELAATVGVDPSHLIRTFRRQFGCPPGEYLRRLRIERACQALERSDAPLAQVAVESGFSDQSHFTRLFRRYMGTTPGAYRAMLRHRRTPATR